LPDLTALQSRSHARPLCGAEAVDETESESGPRWFCSGMHLSAPSRPNTVTVTPGQKFAQRESRCSIGGKSRIILDLDRFLASSTCGGTPTPNWRCEPNSALRWMNDLVLSSTIIRCCWTAGSTPRRARVPFGKPLLCPKECVDAFPSTVPNEYVIDKAEWASDV